jgi:subtilisin-like proprotein convertase family protein
MRSRVTVLGAAALVAGLVLFVGVFAAQERATAAKARTVTKTYTNATPISIPAPPELNTSDEASPYPSQIAVGLRRATIRDVNVVLRSYSHTYPDDVDVLLVGPARTGKDTRIMSDAGAGRDLSDDPLTLDDEAPTLTLDDEAASHLPNGNGQDPDDGTSPIASGSYKPSDHVGTNRSETTVKPDTFPGVDTFSDGDPVALSTFDGVSPRGTWSLYVWDDGHGDRGQFAGGWSLQITARVR